MFKQLVSVTSLVGLALVCAAAGAQTAAPAPAAYPVKPIRLIVPFPPGGGTDILSRLVASKLTEVSKWTVIPDNRAGAGGTIGIAEAVRGAPSGYEMVMGQKDNLVVAPWLYKNLSYDPIRDLLAVAHVAYTPVVIVTSTASRFKTLADVVAAAKPHPTPSPTVRPATAPRFIWRVRSSTLPLASSCAMCRTKVPAPP